MKTKRLTTHLFKKFKEPVLIVAILGLFVIALPFASRYPIAALERIDRQALVTRYFDRIGDVGGSIWAEIVGGGDEQPDAPTPEPTHLVVAPPTAPPATSTPLPTQEPRVVVVTATPAATSTPTAASAESDDGVDDGTGDGATNGAVAALSYPLPFPEQLRGSKGDSGGSGGSSGGASASGGGRSGGVSSFAATPTAGSSDDDGDPFYRGNVVVECVQSNMGVFVNRLNEAGFWERITPHSIRPVAGDTRLKIDGIPLSNAPDRKADPVMIELVQGPEATVLGRIGDYANGLAHLRALYPNQDLVIPCAEVQAVIRASNQ